MRPLLERVCEGEKTKKERQGERDSDDARKNREKVRKRESERPPDPQEKMVL
jgi:hypothetical protein